MIRVFTAQHPAQAHFMKGVLESRGIASEVRGEDLFGARGEIPVWEALPEVWVNDDQADEAREVIRAESMRDAPSESWQCPNCGESVEAQFTTCWQCNTDRPSPDFSQRKS
jgi:putative signal transducing protein